MLHSAARLLLALFVIAAFTTTSAAAANKDLNLRFETGAPGGPPRGWFAGGEGYEAALVSDNPHGGEQCLRLTAVSSLAPSASPPMAFLSPTLPATR
ncbi:MAG: hypothetical protein IPI48_11790 [bacterium]|nr:hypothetical protein [bacterium]